MCKLSTNKWNWSIFSVTIVERNRGVHFIHSQYIRGNSGMYQIENSGQVLAAGKRRASSWWRKPQVSRNVLFLGLTSLFTDISSEMISTILPLYFVLTLGFTPLQFGVVDGLYQGAATLVRLASGVVTDYWRRYKEVAAVGYALSAIAKPALLFAGNIWPLLVGIVVVDRIGKGIRTSPRDALISLSSPRSELATAFGVHRALDTAGAMLGPLVAFGLLVLVPGAFDTIFVVSFCAALIGLGILVLFVQNKPAADATQEPDATSTGSTASAVSLKAAFGLLRMPTFRVLVFVGAALSLFTMSDGFLYLGLQRQLNFGGSFFPLLYVITALIYMVLAVPIGRLADRVGRTAVFIAGYGVLLLAYTSLLLPPGGWLEVLVVLLLLGTYYAATDGVLMALASAALPQELRTSGLGLLTTATGLARLLASVMFGALWSQWGVETAVLLFLAALIVVMIFGAVMLVRSTRGSNI